MPELGEQNLPGRDEERRRRDFTITIGDEVHGRDGKLGTIERVIVDAGTDEVTDLVVSSGIGPFGSARVVPLGCVTGATEDGLRADVSKDDFDTLDGFDPGAYREPDPDYVGPPGFDVAGGRRDMAMNTYVAFGPTVALGQAQPTLGYPGGERMSPDESGRAARPSISQGTDVLDSMGEKVGEVAELQFDAVTGSPTRFVLKQGRIFKDEFEVPVDWVEDLSDKGVVLNVEREQVKSLSNRD